MSLGCHMRNSLLFVVPDRLYFVMLDRLCFVMPDRMYFTMIDHGSLANGRVTIVRTAAATTSETPIGCKPHITQHMLDNSNQGCLLSVENITSHMLQQTSEVGHAS